MSDLSEKLNYAAAAASIFVAGALGGLQTEASNHVAQEPHPAAGQIWVVPESQSIYDRGAREIGLFGTVLEEADQMDAIETMKEEEKET